ncbi:hypothetical protein MMPV_004001 [Pyropia vietnamensis]
MDSDEDHDVIPAAERKQLRSELATALAAFDRAEDWADLIHDLQRVNRVLSKHSRATSVPHKELLAKRLSQCLNASLPSGVHLKALETYALVLSRLPPPSLVSSLPLFAVGLFPLLSYASTALKPTILSLFESHLAPLPPHALAPFLDATVVALLPAIDDDGEPGGEVHARASRLLADLSAPTPSAVDTALWRALLAAPPVRLAAARQLRGRLLAAGPAETLSASGGARRGAGSASGASDAVGDGDADAAVDDLIPLALAAGVADEQALVVRAVLDVVTTPALALEGPYFEFPQGSVADPRVHIVGGVLAALLRCDASLSKRVYAWLGVGRVGGRRSADIPSGGGASAAPSSPNALRPSVGLWLSWTLNSASPWVAAAGGIPAALRVASAVTEREEVVAAVGLPFGGAVIRLLTAFGDGGEADSDVDGLGREVLSRLGLPVLLGVVWEVLCLPSEREGAPCREAFSLDVAGLGLAITATRALGVRLASATNATATDRASVLGGLARLAVVLSSALGSHGATWGVPAVVKALTLLDMVHALLLSHGAAASLSDVLNSLCDTATSWLAAATTDGSGPYGTTTISYDGSSDVRDSTSDDHAALSSAATAFNATVMVVATLLCSPGAAASRPAVRAVAALAAAASDAGVAADGVRLFCVATPPGSADAAACDDASGAAGELLTPAVAPDGLCSVYGGSDGMRPSCDRRSAVIVVTCAWAALHPDLPTATVAAADGWLALTARLPATTAVCIADGVLASATPADRLGHLARLATLSRLVTLYGLGEESEGGNGGAGGVDVRLLLDALLDGVNGEVGDGASSESTGGVAAAERGLAIDWLRLTMRLSPGAVLDGLLLMLAAQWRSGDLDRPVALYAFTTIGAVMNTAFGGGHSGRGALAAGNDDDDDGQGGGWGARQAAAAMASPLSPGLAAALGPVPAGGALPPPGVPPPSADGPPANYWVAIASVALAFVPDLTRRGGTPHSPFEDIRVPVSSGHAATAASGDVVVAPALPELAPSSDGEVHGSAAATAADEAAAVGAAAADLLTTTLRAAARHGGRGTAAGLASSVAPRALGLLHRAVDGAAASAAKAAVNAAMGGAVVESSGAHSTDDAHGIEQRLAAAVEAAVAANADAVEAHPLYVPLLLQGLRRSLVVVAARDGGDSDGGGIGGRAPLGLAQQWVSLAQTAVQCGWRVLPELVAGVVNTLVDALDALDGVDLPTSSTTAALSGGLPHHVLLRHDLRLLLLRGLAALGGRVVDMVGAGVASGELVLAHHALSASQGDGSEAGGGGSGGGLAVAATGSTSAAGGGGKANSGEADAGGSSTSDARSVVATASAPGGGGSGGGGAVFTALNPLRLLPDFVKDAMFATAEPRGATPMRTDPRAQAGVAAAAVLPRVLMAAARGWLLAGRMARTGVARQRGAADGSAVASAPAGRSASLADALARAAVGVVHPWAAAHLADTVAAAVEVLAAEGRVADVLSPWAALEYGAPPRPLRGVCESMEAVESMNVGGAAGTVAVDTTVQLVDLLTAVAPVDALSTALGVVLGVATRWPGTAVGAAAAGGSVSVASSGVQVDAPPPPSEALCLLDAVGLFGRLAPAHAEAVALWLLRVLLLAGPTGVGSLSASSGPSRRDLRRALAAWPPTAAAVADVLASGLRACTPAHALRVLAAFASTLPAVASPPGSSGTAFGVPAGKGAAAADAYVGGAAGAVGGGGLAGVGGGPASGVAAAAVAADVRRVRKELATLTGSAVAAVAAIAGGTVDITAEEALLAASPAPQGIGGRGSGNGGAVSGPAAPPSGKALRLHAAVSALWALADVLAPLVDASVVTLADDRVVAALLPSVVGGALKPAVATLRRVSARYAAVAALSLSASARPGGGSDAESATDHGREAEAATAAAGVVAALAAAEWGFKAVKRELLPLLDEPSFFYGKSWRAMVLLGAATNELVHGSGAAARPAPLPRALPPGGGDGGAGVYRAAGWAVLRTPGGWRAAAGSLTAARSAATAANAAPVGAGPQPPLLRSGSGSGGGDGSGRGISSATVAPPPTNGGVNRAELLTAPAATTGAGVTGGVTAVFAGRDAEAAARSRGLRRTALLVGVAPTGAFAGLTGAVLERLRDALWHSAGSVGGAEPAVPYTPATAAGAGGVGGGADADLGRRSASGASGATGVAGPDSDFVGGRGLGGGSMVRGVGGGRPPPPGGTLFLGAPGGAGGSVVVPASSLSLLDDAFRLLRLLLLRSGAAAVTAFRETTLSELLRVLTTFGRRAAAANRDGGGGGTGGAVSAVEVVDTLAALRLLDVASLVGAAEMAADAGFFLPPPGGGPSPSSPPLSATAASKVPTYVPYVARIAARRLPTDDAPAGHILPPPAVVSAAAAAGAAATWHGAGVPGRPPVPVLVGRLPLLDEELLVRYARALCERAARPGRGGLGGRVDVDALTRGVLLEMLHPPFA